MLAAVLSGVNRVAIRDDVECVAALPGEVTVSIKAAGLCHSDLSAVDGTLWIPTPAVLGHEASGIVDAVGAHVTHVRPGDHVTLAVSMPCGVCAFCTKRRSPHLCSEVFFKTATKPHFRAGGISLAAMGGIGAFSEKVVVPAEAVIPVPNDVPFEVAALLACGTTSGAGAVINKANVEPGASVAVFGLGGVGLSAVMAARIAKAASICAVDVVGARRHRALDAGATLSCPPDELDSIKAKIAPDGFDYAFDATGKTSVMRAAYDATRRGGVTCVIGAGPKEDEVSFSASEIYYNEKTLVGSYHGSADFSRFVPYLINEWRADRFNPEILISDRVRLPELPRALDEMVAGSGIRTVIMFE